MLFSDYLIHPMLRQGYNSAVWCRSLVILMISLGGISRLGAQTYTVNQTGTYAIESNNPVTVSLSENSIYEIPIGFNFTFFGNSYSTCYIAQNGFITFTSGPGGGAGQDIPDLTTPDNLIAAAWTDQDTAVIGYEVLGTSPNKRLVITLSMIDACGAQYYGQVKLFETTNVIELHTQQWAGSNAPCLATTQGLENSAGNVAIEVPGRNSNVTWSVDIGDNDFVSFTPHEIYFVDHDTNFALEFDNFSEITIIEDGLAEIPIGFDFNFFGRTYSSCTIGNNGFLAFGEIENGGCCQGQNIPDPVGPNNLIACAWMEVYQYECCQEGNYYNYYWYETMGVAPNRRLLVYYEIEDVYCGAYFEGQIKLFEGSDIIEIHTNMFADGVTPCAPVTQGIENADGTQAYYPAGRNANTGWSVPCCEEDVIRFTPVSSFPNYDAGVADIDDDPFCEGSPVMAVALRNYGNQEIDSVEVHWKWNGVEETPVLFQTDMPVGTTNYRVNLGEKPIVFGQTYSLKAWTSMPNGYADDRVINDTMSTTIKAGIHGTFTIGGSSPSYATFADAINALQTYGICDSVIFNVRPGSYITQILIPHIEGANGDNKIIFQAENGDSTSVIVQFTSTSSASNYVLRLDGAHNVIWQKMTMKALGTSNARVVELLNDAYNNIVRQCVLEGRNASVSSNSYACIYSNAYNHNNTFTKNTFRYGSFSFYHSDPSRPEGLVFTDNKCIDFYFKGLYAFEPSGIQIHRNLFESSKSLVRGIDIDLEEDSLSIGNNKIYLPLGTHGIRLNGCNQTGNEKLVIFNNLVNVLGANCLAGIDINNSEDVDVIHNTVNISLAAATGFAFLENSGERDSIYNNIFSNSANGQLISSSSNALMHFDHNNFYTAGSTFGNFNGVLVDNLSQWRATSGFDQHSLNVNPLYASSLDLHASNSFLNGAASADHSVAFDYDLQARSITSPDIGADEFTPGADDAAITGVISPIVSCDTLQDIIVVLTNLGSATLQNVTIKWKLNGIDQPDHVFNQPMMPEGDTAHVLLASRSFSGVPDVMKFWTSMPNGNMDAQPSNDTTNFRFRLPLSGTFTIGGTSPDFTTFKSAADDLNSFQTCGSVIFKFRNGVYSEQVVIDSILTADEDHQITFESESLDSSLVTLQWTVTNSNKAYIVLLNGTDYITFRHLGFKSLSTSNANIFEAVNGVTHLTISNSKLEGTLTDVAYSNNHLYKAILGKQEYITFTNNYFLGSTYAINVVNTVGSGNLTPKFYDFNTNTFANQKSGAIKMVNCDSLYIRNNSIFCNTILPYQAIEINSISGYSQISGNEVVCTNNGSGLFINFVNYARQGNANIFNNMFRSAGNGKAMSLWNTRNLQVYFNNAYASGTGTALEIGGGDTMQLRNNVFIANLGPVYFGQTTPTTIAIDYNDAYTSSGVLGYWNNTYNNMIDWQTGTAFDEHSLNVDPQFVSSTDLHVYADTLDMAGLPIPVITQDIDGQLRDPVSPDIGADEIGTLESDAGIRAVFPMMPFARGMQDIKAVIRNYGIDTLMTATISWKINGVSQPDYYYSGPLASLQQDTIIIGQHDFDLNTAYIIKAWTSIPNQDMDMDHANDTLQNSAIYAAVSGDVVIGPTGDLTTIASTISAMNNGGVIGSIRFRIQPGTYHESLVMPAASYQSCVNPIIYESFTGNAADVIWDNVGTGTHTILLDGADGIKFRHLTIKTTINAIQAIRFQNGSSCNVIEYCSIDGVTTANNTNTYAPIFATSTNGNASTYNNNNTIAFTTINNGSYSIYWAGGNGTTGLLIKNNTLVNARAFGMSLNNLTAPVAEYNNITTNVNVAYVGIQLNVCTGQSKINGNTVTLTASRTTQAIGIQLASSSGTSPLPIIVSNNYVIIGNGPNPAGLHINVGTFIQVLHNTLRIAGGTSTLRCLYVQGTTTNTNNLTIRNNIFDSEASGYTTYYTVAYNNNFTTSHNGHYTAGTNKIFYAINYTNFTTWQNTGQDANSVFLDPEYDPDAPLSYRVVNAGFDGTAMPVTYVTTDIENQLRNATMPDMGCDEFDLFTHDVGLVSISYPYQPFPEGTNTVFIKFDNNGEDTLTSMQVHWEVDDVPQPVYQWSGLLPSAATYDSLDIGDYDFTEGEYHYIKVWVSHPNGVQDQLAVNDTLSIDSLYPALSGIYTIGGVDPDFETISGAVFELNKGGAFGEVTFNIRPGTYLETISINDFPGSDCNTPVIFQSETGNASDVLITNLGYNAYTIVLNGADGVIFQNLGITSVNPAYRIVISYANGAHCNQFLNNQITGYESTSTSATAAVIHSATGGDTANVFTGNDIKYGSYSFYLLGNSAAIANTTIHDNILYHPYYRGVYASLESGISIDKNQITPVATNSRGIDLNECHTLTGISGNVISSGGQYGIFINNSDGLSSAQGLISNNFISIGGTSTARGIYLSLSDYQRVLHNNIHVYSTNGTLANTVPLYVSGCASTTIKNNALSNGGPGYAIFSNNNTSFIANHNTYYATGVSLGYWNGISTATIADWRTSSGQDANSLDVNPQFMSNTDLHVSNILLNGTGQFTSPVTEDIDGDMRSNPPDIGADEFGPSLANDAGVFMVLGPMIPFAPGSQPVTIAVKNFGAEPLTTVNIRWVVNGLEQSVYTWTGSLGPAQCDTVILGNYTFSPYTDHDITLWTEWPNNAVDSVSLNDTITVTNLYPAMSGMYTIGGVLPDFNLLSQLEVALNTGGIMGDVTLLFRDGTYAAQLAIQDFPRTSNDFRVRFTSESGDSSLVTWTRNFNVASANNYTIRLNNAHRIDFDHLTLASTKGKVIDLINGSSDISIDHCQVTGVNLADNNAAYSLISSGTTSEDSITITNNLLRFGDYGIYLIGSAGDPELNINISGNAFENCFTESINTRYTSGLRISENTIMNNENRHNGIFAWNAAGSPDISRNDIRLLAGSIYGINLFEIYGTVSIPASINNNYIFITNLPGTNAYGIKQKNGDYVNYYYNTIRLKNTGAAGSAFLGESTSNHTHFRNCIFSNESGGPAFDVPWIPGNNTNSINYSNLYTTGPILATFYFDYTDHTSFQAATNENLQGKNVDPIFTADEPEIFQSALDGSGVPIAGVVTDIYGNARHASAPDIGAREFTLLAHDIGARSLTAPVTYCGLSGAEEVTIRIQNYGASEETGFDVSYSLDGSAWVTENVGALQISPGSYQDYTFTDLVDLDQPGEYSFAIRTSLGSDLNHSNDTLWDVNVLHIPALQLPPTNLLPVNGQTNLETTVSLSWAPASNATVYDVYVWLASQSPPVTPQISNLSQINTLYSSLVYGEEYNWKVVAKNVCNQMVASTIHEFSIRYLPNLQVDTVIAPVTAFSGQSISIEWQVRNTGPGATLSTIWSDAVYLSTDATLNTSFDTYLGAVTNLSALADDAAYSTTGNFVIPEGMIGDFYVFVYADRWNSLTEVSNTNNWERTDATMMISLTPSPDLVVDEVVIPGSAFSGQNIPVTFTVRNNGFGTADALMWRDLVSIGINPTSATGAIPLKNIIRNVNLQPDSSYTVATTVTLPQSISGSYYVYIHTDYLNQEYEFGAENNNTIISDTLDVFLTPPPDLVPISIDIPDTVSSNEVLNISWTVQNAGATSPTSSYWYDRIDLSLSPIYNSNFNTRLTSASQAPPLMAGGTYQKTKSVTIPVTAHGVYYLYATTDEQDAVFEYTYESNNIYRRPDPVVIVSPDLQAIELTQPATTMSGNTIPVSFKIVNQGVGDLYRRNFKSTIYLSNDQVKDGADVELTSVTHSNLTILANDTLLRTVQVLIPKTAVGTYYLLVYTDAMEQVYEDNLESNNIVSGTISIIVYPTPWPDLIPQNIIVEDTVTAGNQISFSYEVKNQGTGNAIGLGHTGIYYSFSPTWNPALATEIVAINNNNILQKDSTYIQNMTLQLPVSIVSNIYYFYVWVDRANAIFENGLDGNNILRSSPVFINGFPPVDLVLDSLYSTLDTLYTGGAFLHTYKVSNSGTNQLLSNTWKSRAYLSVDSLLDTQLDLALNTVTNTTSGLDPGESGVFQSSFIIPYPTNGDFYLFVEIDILDQNMDINRSNNKELLRDEIGHARKVHIVLTPTPDLIFESFSAPSTAICGYVERFEWITKNNGTAPAAFWVEKLYLSTDNVIGQGDLLLQTQTKLNLPAGDSIMSTYDLHLPNGLNGNYVLILQTDAQNGLYETNGENNNIVLRSIVITPPPPSDLVITDIQVPSNVIAGESASISWNTSNQGAYSAYGPLREIVYLSSDQVLDVEDEIFIVRDTSLYLSPQAVRTTERTAPVTGVGVGDFYALVQTDARDKILESSNTNNVTASIDLMNVDVKRLYIDSLTIDTLVNSNELYYKIEIPSTLEGFDLYVRLAGDTLASTNELYIRYGEVPTRAIFDKAFDRPLDSYQEFIIPNIQPGTYYLMAYGLHDTQSQQQVELYARLMTYSLLSVKPDRGGNEGMVTVTLRGSSLDSTDQVRLTDTLFNYVMADTFFILDESMIIARFDLRGMEPGLYTVQTTKPYDKLGELRDAFTVVGGGGADLQVIYSYSPSSFFQNTPVTKLIVEGINNGLNDVENEDFLIEAMYGEQLSLTYQDYLDDISVSEIRIPIQRANGFEHILAPGESIRYEFPMQTTPYPLASIIVIPNE